ncbi:MAG: HAD hydrolase family protein, partial [Turicibacter sp.]|nr:HAD hydrolase family protein [Turicibacter sp.]
MDIKVAFFDVDGTIVDNHSKKDQLSDMELVPTSAVEAIRLLKENGITPFIATGRSPFMIEDLLNGLELDSFICTNGQYAVMNGKVMYEAPYSEELLDKIAKVAKENHVPLLWMP